ncbi:ribonucleoside-diphosphate reductase subunit alpha [Anaplasmataceae bacterium AB001_6]|nr:ribonucleoside-diphosphate reductase subunit alpha [Anaplasmataceae bacterium AB001_6]
MINFVDRKKRLNDADFNCVKLDYSKDDKLTDFCKAILEDRYLFKDEDYQSVFARVANYYADDNAHAQRLYNYMSNLWFIPATPILSNGGTNRGLPISCFLNECKDSLKGIVDLWSENVWLSSKGGGIGSYWGNLRSIGESVRESGKTSGIIPFIVVQNALTLAISQGSLRRGSSAVYLPIDHPEIAEFLDLRRPMGGDPNRKALNMHHGVIISDKFMEAVQNNDDWDLLSPKDKKVVSTVRARDLWVKILDIRVETGEPYIIFIDTIKRSRPDIYKKLGLDVKMSNLCTEITLSTGEDYLGNNRTAVCCLSSLNLEKYDEWKEEMEMIVEDVLRFLDNVLSDFIQNAPEEMKNAVYSAIRERSVGLGVMGFHSYLQKNMISFESPLAKDFNIKIFDKLRKIADQVSQKLAIEKGVCEDVAEFNKRESSSINERFLHKISVAPTASISIIAGSTSPGIDPYTANIFAHRTLTGSFIVRNKFLQELLASKGKNTDEVWDEIINHEGSVQSLDFLSDFEKIVFKTSSEIDQNWVIEHAADRTPFICQAQSLNIFIPPNISKKELHKLHFMAWKKNIKSMYYCRTKSLQRTDKIGKKVISEEVESCTGCDSSQPMMNSTVDNQEDAINEDNKIIDVFNKNNINHEEGCLSCQ